MYDISIFYINPRSSAYWAIISVTATLAFAFGHERDVLYGLTSLGR